MNVLHYPVLVFLLPVCHFLTVNSFRMEEYTEFNIGEMRGGYRADEDGITLWKGNYLTREAESRLSWEEARFHGKIASLLRKHGK